MHFFVAVVSLLAILFFRLPFLGFFFGQRLSLDSVGCFQLKRDTLTSCPVTLGPR